MVANRTVIGIVNSNRLGIINAVLRRKRRKPSQSSKILVRFPKTLPMKIMIRKLHKKNMKNLVNSPARYLEIISKLLNCSDLVQKTILNEKSIIFMVNT